MSRMHVTRLDSPFPEGYLLLPALHDDRVFPDVDVYAVLVLEGLLPPAAPRSGAAAVDLAELLQGGVDRLTVLGLVVGGLARGERGGAGCGWMLAVLAAAIDLAAGRPLRVFVLLRRPRVVALLLERARRHGASCTTAAHLVHVELLVLIVWVALPRALACDPYHPGAV